MVLNLRDYQVAAVDAIEHALYERGKSNGLCVMATGLGKTETVIQAVLNNIKYHEGERVLIMAQNTTLVDQMYQRFLKRAPELEGLKVGPFHYPAIGIEMADRIDSDARILVATRQTLALNDGSRLRNIIEQYGAFSLYIVDEADQSVGDQYQLIHDILLEANPDLKWFGVTATTTRGDGLSLGIRFSEILVEKDITWGITAGWLKEIDPYQVELTSLDLTTASALAFENWMEAHYRVWLAHDGPQHHTIHFLPSLETAQRFCRFMQEQGVAAVHVDSQVCIDLEGHTHRDLNISYDVHRQKVLKQLQEEAIYATNKDVLTRGFDWRKCNMLMNSVTTGQDSTFTQRLGRGTRLPPGVSNLFFDANQQLWRVTWEAGGVEWLREEELPFYPKTIYLDFSRSTAVAEQFASLFGITSIPAKKEKVEEEEENEEEETIVVTSLFKPTAVDHRIKAKKLFRGTPNNWYLDADGDMSTTYGNDVNRMYFVSAPRSGFARQVYASIQQWSVALEAEDEEGFLQVKAFETAYHILSNRFIWIIDTEGLHPMRYYSSWPVLPLESLYPDMGSAHSSIKSVLHVIPKLTRLMVDFYASSETPIDIAKLNSYKHSKNPPSEAQRKLLGTLQRTTLPGLGIKTPIPVPQTLTEASSAISHFYAKAAYWRHMERILKREVYIPLEKGVRIG